MGEWGQEIKKLLKKIKKLSKVKKIFLGLASFIILLFFSWTLLDIVLFSYQEKNEQTVDNFFTYLSLGNYEDAYDVFAEQYKKEQKIEVFKKNVLTAKSSYINYKPTSFKSTKTTIFIFPLGLKYKGEIEYENGEKILVNTFFIWEKNEWKLYLVEFNGSEN